MDINQISDHAEIAENLGALVKVAASYGAGLADAREIEIARGAVEAVIVEALNEAARAAALRAAHNADKAADKLRARIAELEAL